MEIKDYHELIEEKKDHSLLDTADRVYKEFVSPDQVCEPGAMAWSFHVDDTEYYDEMIKRAREKISENTTIANIIYDFLHNEICSYFGIQIIQGERERINQASGEDHSIREYKGKNAGVCFERSILAHNILKILGVDSQLIISHKDHHVYVLAKTSKCYILYDPANPTIHKHNGNDYYLAAMLPIKKGEEFDSFYYGDKELHLKDTNLYKMVYPEDSPENFNIADVKYSGLKLVKTEDKGLDDLTC